MSISAIYPAVSILCFAIAILFFRKKGVPIYRVFFPFMTSMYHPGRMKKDIEREGIWLIIMGYVSFFLYIIIF